MTEAIFGLIGVLVGGLLNGGVSFLGERRQTRAVAKVAARLVASEAEANEIAIEMALEKKAFSLLPTKLKNTEWTAHKTSLAAALNDEEWTAIDYYHLMLEHLMQEVATQDSDTALPEDSIKDIEIVFEVEQLAIEAVRRYAGELVKIRPAPAEPEPRD